MNGARFLGFGRRALWAVLALCCLLACPDFARAEERILNYDVLAEVNKDGSVRITEAISFVVEGRELKRGFYRDLPLRWEGDGQTFLLDIRVESVTRNGRAEPWFLEKDGALLSVGVGDDSLIPRGQQDYAISYVVRNAITREEGKGESWDEFYWNVTGNYWNFPIEQASFTLKLPDAEQHLDARGHDSRLLEINAYTGGRGAKGTNFRLLLEDRVITTKRLRPGEGLTVSYAWPAGLTEGIARPWTIGTFLRHSLLPDGRSWYLPLIPLLSLFLLVLLWKRYGKDPTMPVVIPRFEPPQGMTPGATRAARRAKWDESCLVSDILNLAAKGYLIIEEGSGVAKYVLRRLTPGVNAPELLDDERRLLEHLLPESRPVLTLHTSEFQILAAGRSLSKIRCATVVRRAYSANSRYVLAGLLPYVLLFFLVHRAAGPDGLMLAGVTLGITAFLALFFSHGMRAANPVAEGGTGAMARRMLPLVFAFALGCIPAFLLGEFSPQTPAGWLGMGWLGLILASIFAWLMPRRTQAGVEQLAEIEGLAMYMDVAEQHRLAALYPPEDSIERFERLLPYALALDVAETWANRFDDYLQKTAQQPPQSIAFVAGNRGWSRNFNRTMRNLGRTYSAASVNPERKSSGSSGGFGSSGRGGGGFSGGGRGGGGGRGR